VICLSFAGLGLFFYSICFSTFMDIFKSPLSMSTLLWCADMFGWHCLFGDSRLLWVSLLWPRWVLVLIIIPGRGPKEDPTKSWILWDHTGSYRIPPRGWICEALLSKDVSFVLLENVNWSLFRNNMLQETISSKSWLSSAGMRIKGLITVFL